MESSFKKNYEKINHPDGSVELKFKGARLGENAPIVGLLLIAILLIPSCAVTYPVALMFGLGGSGSSDGFGAMVFWMFLSIIPWSFLYAKILIARRSLLIKPGQGIIFDGKSLPFSEIQTIYTVNAGRGSCYVGVDANGSEIRLTHYLKQPLADAIRREIMEASGNSWS